jgi:hypothetical protein
MKLIGRRGLGALVALSALATTLATSSTTTADVTVIPVYSQLTFKIGSGGQGIRADSSVALSVSLPGGAQSFVLKARNEPAWFANTITEKTFTLSGRAQPLTAFGAMTITLTSHNGAFESDDAWNVQSVNVTTGPGAPACVVNQSGNPLRRLTGSTPSVTLTPRTGC